MFTLCTIDIEPPVNAEGIPFPLMLLIVILAVSFVIAAVIKTLLPKGRKYGNSAKRGFAAVILLLPMAIYALAILQWSGVINVDFMHWLITIF